MKRFIASLLGTVAGVVALLTFKAHSAPVATRLGASLGDTSSTGSSSPSPSSSSASSPSTPSQPASAEPSRKTFQTVPAGSVTPAPQSTSASSGGPSRTVTGKAEQNPYGQVQVKITVSGKTITGVSIVKLTAPDPISQSINSQAGPLLLHETLVAQDAKISAISGATYTSDSYTQSLQSALDEVK